MAGVFGSEATKRVVGGLAVGCDRERAIRHGVAVFEVPRVVAEKVVAPRGDELADRGRRPLMSSRPLDRWHCEQDTVTHNRVGEFVANVGRCSVGRETVLDRFIERVRCGVEVGRRGRRHCFEVEAKTDDGCCSQNRHALRCQDSHSVT